MQETFPFSVWSHEKLPTHCPTMSLRKDLVAVGNFSCFFSFFFQAALNDKCRAQLPFSDGAKERKREKKELTWKFLYFSLEKRLDEDWNSDSTQLCAMREIFIALNESKKAEHQHQRMCLVDIYITKSPNRRKNFSFLFSFIAVTENCSQKGFSVECGRGKSFSMIFIIFSYQLIAINIYITAIFFFSHRRYQHRRRKARGKQQLSTFDQ